MFKTLVPVVALALLAGPVFAADAPATAPAAEQPAAPAKSHHKKHHKKSTKAGASTTDQSNAPAK
jgi:Spy/CpxP family protein refolding chaperone